MRAGCGVVVVMMGYKPCCQTAQQAAGSVIGSDSPCTAESFSLQGLLRAHGTGLDHLGPSVEQHMWHVVGGI